MYILIPIPLFKQPCFDCQAGYYIIYAIELTFHFIPSGCILMVPPSIAVFPHSHQHWNFRFPAKCCTEICHNVDSIKYSNPIIPIQLVLPPNIEINIPSWWRALIFSLKFRGFAITLFSNSSHKARNKTSLQSISNCIANCIMQFS